MLVFLRYFGSGQRIVVTKCHQIRIMAHVADSTYLLTLTSITDSDY
jgi:hypothetical protein